jgi:Tol biopolymer transport system component
MNSMLRCALTNVLLLGAAGSAQGQNTTRASVAVDGTQGNHNSEISSLSGDGRYVVFLSRASSLVAGDTNGRLDVFRHDRTAGTTLRVSVDSSGAESDGDAELWNPRVTPDGRFVSFTSFASNLAAGDVNGVQDVFVHDVQTGATTLESVDPVGNAGDGKSWQTSLSADGRWIAFASDATNLVGGDSNGEMDVFLRDRQTGVTVLASVDSSGAQGNLFSSRPSLSADARHVAFDSAAGNLVAGDTNGHNDVFVRDMQLGQTRRVSVSSLGVQGNSDSRVPFLSADGRFVAFASDASQLVPGDTNIATDIFVFERLTATTSRASVSSSGIQADAGSYAVSLSNDGRYVAFFSNAGNLAPGAALGGTQVFVRDTQTNTTTCSSLNAGGTPGNSTSYGPSVSDDGRFVSFDSGADNLVPADTNHAADVFVHELTPLTCPTVAFYCQSKVNSQGCLPELSTTGVCSASAGSGFVIQATSIVPKKFGLFYYSTKSAASIPSFGGWVCVKQPIFRTFVQNSGGAATCSGSFAIDFNARIAAGLDPALTVGTKFWGQFWYRDPASFGANGLTHAVTTVICVVRLR